MFCALRNARARGAFASFITCVRTPSVLSECPASLWLPMQATMTASSARVKSVGAPTGRPLSYLPPGLWSLTVCLGTPYFFAAAFRPSVGASATASRSASGS